MEPPGLRIAAGDDASQQHVDTAGLVELATTSRQRNTTCRSEHRVEHLARLCTLIRAAGLCEPDSREQRQSPVRRLDTDALLRLIRGVALERPLTDPDVTVQSHGRLAFRRGRD